MLGITVDIILMSIAATKIAISTAIVGASLSRGIFKSLYPFSGSVADPAGLPVAFRRASAPWQGWEPAGRVAGAEARGRAAGPTLAATAVSAVRVSRSGSMVGHSAGRGGSSRAGPRR